VSAAVFARPSCSRNRRLRIGCGHGCGGPLVVRVERAAASVRSSQARATAGIASLSLIIAHLRFCVVWPCSPNQTPHETKTPARKDREDGGGDHAAHHAGADGRRLADPAPVLMTSGNTRTRTRARSSGSGASAGARLRAWRRSGAALHLQVFSEFDDQDRRSWSRGRWSPAADLEVDVVGKARGVARRAAPQHAERARRGSRYGTGPAFIETRETRTRRSPKSRTDRFACEPASAPDRLSRPVDAIAAGNFFRASTASIAWPVLAFAPVCAGDFHRERAVERSICGGRSSTCGEKVRGHIWPS